MMSCKENSPLPAYFITEKEYMKFPDTACMKASEGEQVISSISNFFLLINFRRGIAVEAVEKLAHREPRQREGGGPTGNG